MSTSLSSLGEMIKAHRESRNLTQEQLAASVGDNANRSTIAHLEQGRRVPEPTMLAKICSSLRIPELYWIPFTDESTFQVLDFEEALGELTGQRTTISHNVESVESVARLAIARLFSADLTDVQTFDVFRSILIQYGIKPLVSNVFFQRYLRAEAFKSSKTFLSAVRAYQSEAIRVFNSLETAFIELNSTESLENCLQALQPKSDQTYRARVPWDLIEVIKDENLPNLGYIAANLVKQEQAERTVLSSFLVELAELVEKSGPSAISEVKEKRKRKMNALLQKFNSTLKHGFLSPLFISDSDLLRREAEFVAPKNEGDLAAMAETQGMGLRNLARYLSADHLDVYVATSMRLPADFVSVNSFVTKLFSHQEIRPLKLRYFNPTQSWIEDRVAKGLVEALMLKRADITIYMAQKEDSFGKDSEASVALGQGKPVIVFVPKLNVPEIGLDTEAMATLGRDELINTLAAEGNEDDRDLDETMDSRALMSRLMEIRLQRLSDSGFVKVAKEYWADFGLYAEAIRIQDESLRKQFRSWLDDIVKLDKATGLPEPLKEHLIKMLVATAVRFEDRSLIFRETHPLALQVILSTGVLNGMIVVRSVESCARILKGLIENNLSLELQVDAFNYRLIETTTHSTIRVISRHGLIESAFSTYYKF